MSTGLLIALIVVAAIVMALVLAGSWQRRARRMEERRVEAGEHREEARIRSSRADRREAEAEEQAAKGRRDQALADEQAALAAQERRSADERYEHADRVDPDTDHEDGPREREPSSHRSDA